MDSQKNNQAGKGCDVMDSPKNAALKAINQNIAEKPRIDKIEKEFLNLNQQIEKNLIYGILIATRNRFLTLLSFKK